MSPKRLQLDRVGYGRFDRLVGRGCARSHDRLAVYIDKTAVFGECVQHFAEMVRRLDSCGRAKVWRRSLQNGHGNILNVPPDTLRWDP